MGLPRARGTPIAPDVPRGALSRGVGDVNMQVRGTSLGKAAQNEPAGHLDAVWAVATIAAAGELRVPHGLGRVPAWAKVWEIEDQGASGGQIVVTSSRKKDWSASEIMLRIGQVTAPLAGLKITVLIG